MPWLYDIAYCIPEIWAIQMMGAFMYEGQAWPAGSWYLIHYGQGGRRRVISDAQFRALDATHGEAVINQTHSAGGSPPGPHQEWNARKRKTGLLRPRRMNALRR